MSFAAYIERQKNLIRKRHEGETVFMQKDEAINVKESERIFSELDSLKGLNKLERMSLRKRV